MKNFGYVLAPKVLVSNKLKVRFMYREKSDNPNDSGWRFFSGDEEQEYIDNPNNIGIFDVSTILAIDGDIEQYLEKPIGSAFERESLDSDFVVSEFDFGSELPD